MKLRTLIRRNLCFHWRAHLGVVLGAAVGSAALIGALVVGDSVKGSLKERALARLGRADFAIQAGDRLISPKLAEKFDRLFSMQAKVAWSTNRETGGHVAPMFHANAILVKADGSARANRVNLYVGIPPVDYRPEGDVWVNFDIPEAHDPAEATKGAKLTDSDNIFLNESLAHQLDVKVGDVILIRFAKSAALAADAAVSPRNDQSVSTRLRVGAIISANDMGNFSLRSSQIEPRNAFISRHTLTNLTREPFRANILNASWSYRDWPAWTRWRIWQSSDRFDRILRALTPWTHTFPAEALNGLLGEFWNLADAQAELRSLPEGNWIELRSERVFVEQPLAKAAFSAESAKGILTLLATLLHTATNATPYSMVTAAGSPWTPADLRDDEIVISQWLADDLHVKPGDEIAMSYFLPESGAKLAEATNTFRVRSIVPMEMPWADRTLMPDFPGIQKAESTSEWDAGFPLTYKIRQKDEDYWKQHRGTPKAFITLAAGQKMWGNRFGNLTAIRFPIPGSESRLQAVTTTTTHTPDRLKAELQTAESYRATLEKKILANLKPEELGLRFEPVREQALKAAEESQDFGGLFLSFSFFVIAAALLLMGLLFQLGLEQRAPEIGTLLALGFTPKQVRKLLLREGVALSFIGGILGTIGGIYYAKAMLHGLTTVWRDAVGASALNFHFTAQTLMVGLFASVVVSAATIWLTLRKFVRRPAMQLLNGETQAVESNVQRLKPKVFAGGALLAALGLVGSAIAKGDTSNAGAFFGAGALVLISGLCFASTWLARLGGAPVSDPAPQHGKSNRAGSETGAPITLSSLAVRGCARRRKRSLATIAMLACGSFLIVSIGVFRLDANRDATKRSSGTGGFALIGEATMPVVQDLNSKSGREFFALNETEMKGVSFVPFRVREGDEASCLNLNAAQKPRLLGVKPWLIEERFTFSKSLSLMTKVGPWGALYRTHPSEAMIADDEIPAIGDANSIQWAMHKKVGDTIDYVDERGQAFKVRIVGAVANSILQGQLIIDEAEFVKRFPGESGYRMFLVDAPSNAVSQVSATLSRAMQDVGLELTPTTTRLNQFNAVQNTYLGTFQVLGGLGLLLGSVGLGVVVLRNVLERRGELAVMMAVGFRKAMLQRMLLIENGALLLAGLALGIVAAAVSVLPALFSASNELPVASLAITLGGVLLNGALWTWVATRMAVRGDLLKALRNE